MKILLSLLLAPTVFFAQQSINATGGNASSSTGSFSYSVGQMVYIPFSGTNGFVNPGVQYNFNSSSLLVEDEIKSSSILIYPNPTKDVLNFSEEVSDIKIIDVSGKIVLNYSSAKKILNLAFLPNGIFLLTAKTKRGEKITHKIIKE
ncbi:MAG: T9SS type A sorting domain-containing protein [Bacteroidetes bacterium]|jgi:hypothetical protein|nr:T9SS type A sorting domain-containing protein [Bacteroidota bacterium]